MQTHAYLTQTATLLSKLWSLECELIFKIVPSGASTWAAQPQTTSSPEWSCWSEWSECSASCGGPGTRKRNRVCVPGTNNVGSQVCSITLNIFYRFFWLLGIFEIPWGRFVDKIKPNYETQFPANLFGPVAESRSNFYVSPRLKEKLWHPQVHLFFVRRFRQL